jgi:hypothetical protein
MVIGAAALWRAAVDWQATIGAGYAYRPSSVGATIAENWPGGYARLVEGLKASGVPFAWDPIGALVMSAPLSLLLAAIALLLWATRTRAARRR